MFKHLLLPVDGSISMEGVVRKCILFAAGIGADVVAVHVRCADDSAALGAETGSVALAGSAAASQGERILQYVAAEAALHGVRCEGRLLEGVEPWRAIVRAAVDEAADLVCMGSHGRHGASDHVLASQTAAVLAHTQLPVLLYR